MELRNALNILIQRRGPGSYVPMTPVQCHEWNAFIKSAKGTVRINAASARILGPLSIDLLRKCIHAVVRRHESLRSRIIIDGGAPRPLIDEAHESDLEVVDLLGLSPMDTDSAVQLHSREFVEQRFDLSSGPAVAAKLLKLSEREHVLLMAIHHAFMDGASCGIIRREIWGLYDQAARELPFSLPELQLAFSDYAVWLHQTRDAWLDKHEGYWRRRLLGATYELPPDERLSGVQEARFVWPIIPLGIGLSDKLRDIAWQERTPLPIVVLAVLVAMMWRWLNQDDFVVKFVFHGRHGRPKLARMVGFLANFLHLRIQVPANSSFIDLLKLVNLEFLSAREHEDYHRVPDFIPDCKSALFFNWGPDTWSQWPAREGDAVGPLIVQPFPTRLPIEVDVNVAWRSLWAWVPACNFDFSSGEGIAIAMPYMTHVIASDTMDRLEDNLPLFAEELVQSPLSPIAAAVFRD